MFELMDRKKVYTFASHCVCLSKLNCTYDQINPTLFHACRRRCCCCPLLDSSAVVVAVAVAAMVMSVKTMCQMMMTTTKP